MRRISGAGITGDHDEASVSDAEFDAAAEGIDGGSGEEGVEGDVWAERMELESEDAEQFLGHDSSSVSKGTKAGGSPVAA